MRHLALAFAVAFALLALVPGSAAQAPDLDLVTLAIDPFEGHVKPLQAPAITTIHLRISCALVRSPAGATISYAVASAPRWATATISPATDVVEIMECDDGWATREAELIVQASDRAPAFRPTDLVVEARVNEAETASANVSLTADYFSIVDVQLAEAIVVVKPGATHDFEVGIGNRGNGATTVSASFGDGTATEGLTVSLPGAITLGSAQQGDADTDVRIAIRVVADEAEGFVNEVRVINVALASASAEDATAIGDDSQISMLVTIRSQVADVPGFAFAALIAALLAGAGLRRRSS